MSKNKERNTNQGVAIALGLAMLLGITGCAEKETEPPQEDVSAEADAKEGDSATDDTQNDDDSKDSQDGEDGEEAPQTQADDGTQEDAQAGADATGVSELTDSGAGESGGQTIDFTEGAEHLGGKIQSLTADGMMFAHTSLVEDGSVTLLDVEDAEKIEVKYTADTKVEHWIIQGGGAGIDMQDAAFSDLQEGMGVELEGYYDGETFVATKVIMEDYE
ncbi:MAG: hypothetical protein OSJ72_07845 [Lachnospiraceae bacterium]|nr:hypothetical protein [Lachnospiraceae bacterium]